MIKVAIDYGHGWNSPANAKRYRFTPDGPEAVEGRQNREVAAHLFNLLWVELAHVEGAEVHDVVAGRPVRPRLYNTGGRLKRGAGVLSGIEMADVPLRDRVAYANSVGADIFVSLHANAIGQSIEGPSLPARGYAFFTSPGQTRADPAATAFYEAFRQRLPELRANTDGSDGDPDKEARFYVLQQTAMPAVVCELGFFTNLDEWRFIRRPLTQRRMAAALVGGLRSWEGWPA